MAEQQVALIADAPPVGSSFNYNGTADPAGGVYMIEDGRALSRTTYPVLFTALGGTLSPFGLPDGSTFNIPDKRGRTDIGAGTGTGLTARAVGATDGEESHLLAAGETPLRDHKHTVYATKVANTTPTNGSSDKLTDIRNTSGGGSSGDTSDPTTSPAVVAHNNMQPFIARHSIIKVR